MSLLQWRTSHYAGCHVHSYTFPAVLAKEVCVGGPGAAGRGVNISQYLSALNNLAVTAPAFTSYHFLPLSEFFSFQQNFFFKMTENLIEIKDSMALKMMVAKVFRSTDNQPSASLGQHPCTGLGWLSSLTNIRKTFASNL